MKPFLSFLLVLITLVGWAQNKRTFGDNSPIIQADRDISVRYGVPAELVQSLLAVYEADNYNSHQRIDAVEKILTEYNKLGRKEEQDCQLTPRQKRKLGIKGQPQVENLLEWNTFLTTYGNYSPVLVARGDIEVAYGMPIPVFEQVWKKLEAQRRDVEQSTRSLNRSLSDLANAEDDFRRLEQDLKASAKAYRELLELLKISNDEAADEARNLLAEGELDEAIRVMKNRRYALQRIRERTENELDLAQAEAAFILGKAYAVKLVYDSALLMYKEALSFRPSRPDYAFAYGNQLYLLEQHDSAFAVLNQSFQKDSARLPQDSIGEYLNLLGSVSFFLGDVSTPIPYFERAGEAYKNHFGEQHESFAKVNNNLGALYLILGEYDKALEYLNKAVDINKAIHGDDFPDIATSYCNIGAVLLEKGQYEEAGTYFRNAIQIDSTVFGQGHPNLARDYNNLGTALARVEQFDEAIRYIQKGIGIDTVIYGPLTPRLSTFYNNLASAYQDKGNHEEAISLYKKVIRIDSTLFGSQYLNLSTGYNNLATLYAGLAEYKKALPLAQKAYEIDVLNLGESHPRTGVRLLNLGSIQEGLGNLSQAQESLGRTCAIFFQTLPPTHPYQTVARHKWTKALNKYGVQLFQQKKIDSAYACFQKADSVGVQNGNHTGQIISQFNMGILEMEKGKWDSAISRFDRGLIEMYTLKAIEPEWEFQQFAALEIEHYADSSNKVSPEVILRYLTYYKGACMVENDQYEEAEILFQRLWQEGMDAEDHVLLTKIKGVGYEF